MLSEQEESRTFITEIVEKYDRQRSALLPILWAIQEKYGYVSESAMQQVGDLLGMHASGVWSVATFYRFIHTRPKGKFIIRLSRDIASIMKGAKEIALQLEKELGIRVGETTPDGMFSLEWTGSIGMDDQAPAMMINNEVFSHLSTEDIPRIIRECTEAFLAHRPLTGKVGETFTTARIYANHTADSGLRQAIAMSADEIMAEVSASGLCGRGGAGFPTGTKWKMAANASGDTHYVVCNADEGEPGTFKDRFILTRFADLVFEGMTIAARAIGASKGFLYLRAEYAKLLPQLEQILKARREAGLLGNDILGSKGFNFEIHLRLGAGAYICGEETALLESLEGKRGEPRSRPPYPTEIGLHGQPTVVNNVETLATVSVILARGAEWFSGIGTAKSKGFKLFSVSGDCARPGLYELPWGITVAGLLTLVGGEGAKAVQIGGYSGTLLPAAAFNRQLAYEDIGAGSTVIIYGPERDLLEVAENYLEFFVDESCGQCTPCRDGNGILLSGIRMLLAGTCTRRQLDELLSLCKTIRMTSKCGLGQTSPKILLAINEYFRDELTARLAAPSVDGKADVERNR
ncbi:NAD(P)H-dependent oxidoreductase subunit E [Tolumonas osonensis]|uniref:NADH-quinone oxidoreductase subunit F n=1 Tax=Tolumonas osonensis TaxID=675874 RepID=A0A841GHA1_9GAMM|nr:NAD(P)H-dependent oxidoreductase subunit E [Tolumonas osonensis]MBB6054725.1 [NiFe] hydrogenase diaphorase moiety large subunit [Tolumonas osonensis]